MCGFLAEYDITNPLTDKNNFIGLLDLSEKREPDLQGYYKSDTIQLGFNRLAILDLFEAGNQPMSSPNNRFTIVFNGEIYLILGSIKKLFRKC